MSELVNLLRKNQKNSPTYTTEIGKLSNHLSMTLIALNKLGANDHILVNFANNYSLRTELDTTIKNKILINDKNWKKYLGKNGYNHSYVLFFKNSIQAIGVENTIKKYLEILLEGIAELHGVIRLAYAIESKDTLEIAASLGYFAAYYRAYYKKNDYRLTFNNPSEGFRYIKQHVNLTNKNFSGQNIDERLHKVFLLTEFSAATNHLKLNENTLKDCASLIISLYAMTSDFVVLHAMTITHSLRIIWPYIENHENCLQYYWQIICAIYIYVGAPEFIDSALIERALNQNTLSWEILLSKTLTSTDAHVIKFVYSCYEEDKLYKNPLYLSSAMKKLEDDL